MTIARRELSVLFLSPVGYVLLGIFACITTLFFVLAFLAPNEPATMRGLFGTVVFVLLIFLAPAISMRLMSEEFGRGTIEPLMTAPISDTQVVLGKFLGALAFLAILLAWLAVPVWMLEVFSDPDYGPILSGLAGLLLVGALFLAIGLFASSLTGSQVIAFMLALFMISPLLLVAVLGFVITLVQIPDGLREALFYLSIYRQFDAFNRGLVDLGNVVYFASGVGMFLFFAVQVIQSRRWR